VSLLGERVLDEIDPDAPLYAVLDGARDRRVRSWIVETRAPAYCLYQGDLPSVLQDAAPWLLRLGRGHGFTERFFEDGWLDDWGVVLASNAPVKLLRRHLRRFLLARTEDGRRMVFRYYDPRVLRIYLPTCNAEELKAFFGPVLGFATSDEERAAYNLFKLKDGALEQQRIVATGSITGRLSNR
jgi:Domain of unknown function (DUF4123)